MWGQSPQHANIQHRLVYQVLQEEYVVKVLRLWTHYEQLRKNAGYSGHHGTNADGGTTAIAELS